MIFFIEDNETIYSLVQIDNFQLIKVNFQKV